MDTDEKLFNDFIHSDANNSIQSFLDRLDSLITNEIGIQREYLQSDDLFDKHFLTEVKDFDLSDVTLYFGKTLRDLKCVISYENCREHEIWIQHVGPKDLRIRDMNLPQSDIQGKVYKSLDEVVNAIKKHVNELSNYFNELYQIDINCTVMEPVRPTFKEDYRKIQLADKTWLHVEVSPDGFARNLSVLGQYDQTQFQEILQAWDCNETIVANVFKIIGSLESDVCPKINQAAVVPDCGICYCVELPGDTRVPQPLCNNSKCGAYFHRSCLYEWLVASARGRMPKFGVGKCPSCSQYIQCSDKDIR